MSRYRPPKPRSSPYITAEGFARLQEESRQLWVTREQVTRALAAAAAEGDRSENAEYIYRKKQLREIDRRIGYLQRRMPQLQVIDKPPADCERIFFGAWVSLEDDEGNENRYQIVGADEFDAERNRISVDAPLARALLGRAVGDQISVDTPGGQKQLEILGIHYRPQG